MRIMACAGVLAAGLLLSGTGGGLAVAEPDGSASQGNNEGSPSGSDGASGDSGGPGSATSAGGPADQPRTTVGSSGGETSGQQAGAGVASASAGAASVGTSVTSVAEESKDDSGGKEDEPGGKKVVSGGKKEDSGGKEDNRWRDRLPIFIPIPQVAPNAYSDCKADSECQYAQPTPPPVPPSIAGEVPPQRPPVPPSIAGEVPPQRPPVPPSIAGEGEEPVVDFSGGGVPGDFEPPVLQAPLVVALPPPVIPAVAAALGPRHIANSAGMPPRALGSEPGASTPLARAAGTPLVRDAGTPPARDAGTPLARGVNPAAESIPANASTPMAWQTSRLGYSKYLRTATVSEFALVALPGLAGLIVLTFSGVGIGYRQANAGRYLLTERAERFLR